MIKGLRRRKRFRLKGVTSPADRMVAAHAFAAVLRAAIDMREPHRAPSDVHPLAAFSAAVAGASRYANEELQQTLDEFEEVLVSFHHGRSMLETTVRAEGRFIAACRMALTHGQ